MTDRIDSARETPPDGLTSGGFWLVHAGAPLLLALALLFGFEQTDADRALSDLFFDPVMRHFPLRYDWFLEVVMHRWAKYALVLIGLGVLVAFALSFIVPRLGVHRRALLFVFLAMAGGPALVGYMKDVSNKHCPYDLEIYGGFAPYTRLLEQPAAGVRSGRCFPGGHASGGFALMATYFVWYRTRRRWAYAGLMGGFAYGFILGFGRLMQGAHFLSHNLWAAIVCWFVALALYRVVLKGHQDAAVPRAATALGGLNL